MNIGSGKGVDLVIKNRQQLLMFQLVLLLAGFTLLAYAWTFWKMPLMGEDFAFPPGYGNHEMWMRLEWVMEHIHFQTTTWNARLGEQLAIFWLSMPRPIFTLVATAAFIGLNALIALVYSGRDGWLYKCAISIAACYLLWPGLEVFFWRTANAGYLQPVVLTLICIVAYRSELAIEKLCHNKIKLFLITVVAALAGYSFENVPIAVMAYLLLCWGLSSRRWTLWPALFPVMAMGAGWCQLMLMPSTSHRRDYYLQAYGVSDPDFSYYFDRATDVARVFFETSWILFVLAVISLVFLGIRSRSCKGSLELRAWLTIVPALLLVGSVMMAPYTEPRSFTLAWALMLAVVVEAFWQLTRGGRYYMFVTLIVMIMGLGVSLKTAVIYKNVSDEFNARESRILGYKGAGQCEIGVPVELKSFDYDYRYFNNRDEWTMGNLQTLSNYYDCHIVKTH